MSPSTVSTALQMSGNRPKKNKRQNGQKNVQIARKGEIRNACETKVGNLKKDSTRKRRVDGRMITKQYGTGVDWIYLAHDRDRRQGHVNRVLHVRV
jgi:hypothetical protein